MSTTGQPPSWKGRGLDPTRGDISIPTGVLDKRDILPEEMDTSSTGFELLEVEDSIDLTNDLSEILVGPRETAPAKPADRPTAKPKAPEEPPAKKSAAPAATPPTPTAPPVQKKPAKSPTASSSRRCRKSTPMASTSASKRRSSPSRISIF